MHTQGFCREIYWNTIASGQGEGPVTPAYFHLFNEDHTGWFSTTISSSCSLSLKMLVCKIFLFIIILSENVAIRVKGWFYNGVTNGTNKKSLCY